MCNIYHLLWIKEWPLYQWGVWFKVYGPKIYTTYIIWSKMMSDLWQKSLKYSSSQGLFALCVFWYFAEDVLYDFLCQGMRQSAPLTTGPHALPSGFFQLLFSCVNSLTATEVLLLGKAFSRVILFLPAMSSLMIRDLWSPSKVYLSTKASPIFILRLWTMPGLYTVCHRTHLLAAKWTRRF